MALRKFIDGEVFYSEDLDSLSLASTLRFPNAAARDAALIGELAPVHGTQVAMADDGGGRLIRRSASNTWLPMPGTMCFSYAATGSQSISPQQSYPTTVTGWNSNLIGRNFNNWFNISNGYFKPDINGYFEMCGGVCFNQSGAYGLSRNLCLVNHYTSGYNMTPGQSVAMSTSYGASSGAIYIHMPPTVIRWSGVNNTGSGIALQAWNGYSSALYIGIDGPSYFSAKYLGP